MIQKSRDYQSLYDTDKRYIIITGGRGSGKSFEVGTFISLLTYEQQHRILFTRYTMASAGISIIPEFMEKIELMEVAHHFDINKSEITNTETGSDILFRGIKTSSGNQTANLKSLQGVTTWVLDEAEELVDENIFDTIDLSIRKKGIPNRIILVMNPSTKEHWVWKRFFDGNVKYIDVDGEQIPVSNHPDICHIHTTYLNNRNNLSESYLKRLDLIKQNNPGKYKHLVLGGWLEKAEGVIFENWQEGIFDDSLPFVYGMDFGYVTDPTTLVKIAKDGDTLYLKEELYRGGMDTNSIASFLDRTVDKHNLIVADNAEPRLISELQDKGFNIVPCQKGKDSIKNGIANLSGVKMIVEGQNLIKELNNYSWSNKRANIPNDNYNHLIDAVRYGFIELSTKNEFYFA